MVFDTNSIAAANAVGVKNVQFQPSADVVPRKNLIIATYDPLKTSVVPEVPVQIFSPDDAGDKFGFGTMAHRLAVQSDVGAQGIETWMQPQEEAGGAVVADGKITWTSSGAKAGTVYLYIAGILVSFTVADADADTVVSSKAVDAINANKNLPVTAAIGAAPADTEIEARSKGPWGNDISIKFNIKVGEALPTGVTAVVVAMASGAGIPTISDALDALGTGDDANGAFFTDVVHGYGQDTTTLDAILTYVGAGNTFTGLYTKTVARPFRVLTGDVVAEAAGLTALIALGDGRKLDRANGVIAVPGSASHPSEIAAQAMGHMSRINNNRAEEHYLDIVLIGIDPGVSSDRWTSDYDNRDAAVKAGVSPTKVSNGAVVMQNVVTFYHPDNVPVNSNGYRSMRNISILQNIMTNIRTNFSQEKWQGISIVEDVTNVSDVNDRVKAKDVSSVIDDFVALSTAFAGKAWLYTASFTIDKLKEADAVVIRAGNDGFDNKLSIILSGEGGILNTTVEFDTSIAVLL